MNQSPPPGLPPGGGRNLRIAFVLAALAILALLALSWNRAAAESSARRLQSR